mgnify:CR=1 FL=1
MNEIVTLYKFVNIINPNHVQKKLKSRLRELKIHGTILVGNEGINGTISSDKPENLSLAVGFIESIKGFNNIDLKYSQSQKKPFEITDSRMTRFNITLNQGVKFVVDAIKKMNGGEIFVPKLSSFRILDLAKAIDAKAKIKFTGINYGEKIHEEMISSNETGEILSFKDKYIILPDMEMISWNKKIYFKTKPYPKILRHFTYQSNKNEKFLNLQELKNLLKKNF